MVASYSAFCRKYGDYHTDWAGRRIWNEEAMVGMVADLTGQWQLFVSETDGHFDAVTQAIENVMDWAVKHLGRFEIIGWPRPITTSTGRLASHLRIMILD